MVGKRLWSPCTHKHLLTPIIDQGVRELGAQPSIHGRIKKSLDFHSPSGQERKDHSAFEQRAVGLKIWFIVMLEPDH